MKEQRFPPVSGVITGMSSDREDVQAVIGSILTTEQNGLSLQRLDGEYRSIVGCQIPFRELGHASLTAFLKSIPDVVTLHRHLDGSVTVYGAHNAATAHIARLVAQQKPSKNCGAGPMRARKTQHAQRPCHWQVHPYHKNFQVGANSPRAGAPKGDPKASARAPLRELPRNFQNRGNPPSANRPAGNQGFGPGRGHPFATSSEQGFGFRRPELRAWTSFLASTGLPAGKVPVYADLLLRQGVHPGGLWLFTAEDIRRLGIVDHRDVRLLQERAHAVRTLHGPAAAGNSFYETPRQVHNDRWQGSGHLGNINHWPKHCDQRSEREPRVGGGQPAVSDPATEAFPHLKDEAWFSGHSSEPDLYGGTSVGEGETRMALLNMAAWHLAQSSLLMGLFDGAKKS